MIALLMAAMLAQASPGELPSSMVTLGIGGNSCRTWTIRRRQDIQDRVVDKQWLAGFLTGIGFMSGAFGASELVRTNDNPDTLIGYVDDYCELHPLESVGEAALALYVELVRRAQH